MRQFKICYPDANNFDKMIKIKNINEWNVEYVPLDQNIGFWIAENPFQGNGFELFRELVSAFPIQKDNNDPNNFDPNPFDTIHLPEWVYKNLCFLIKDFYLKHTDIQVIDPQIHEWGNVYYKKRSNPISCWRIPHIDYVHGIVANLWFTNHDISQSSTRIYRYKGTMFDEIYDFQVDENHKMHKRWKELAEQPKRKKQWFNMTNDELSEWGFEYLGDAPTKEGTMTMYRSNVCHSAFVAESVDFRWSHAFAFSHLLPKETFLRDILV